jgi:hypothetical protein
MADDTRNLAIELIAMRATVQVMIATLERSGAPGLIEAIRSNIGQIIQGEALVLPASVAGRDVFVQEIREYALQIISEARAMAPPTDEELARNGL